MSDILKCPICKKPLQPIGDVDTKYPTTSYYCPNDCVAFAFGNLPMWNELKRVYDNNSDWEKEALDYKAKNIALSGELELTRKALDAAVDVLKEINDRYESEEQRGREEDDSPDWWDFAMDTGEILTKALEQITAEQKDKQ